MLQFHIIQDGGGSHSYQRSNWFRPLWTLCHKHARLELVALAPWTRYAKTRQRASVTLLVTSRCALWKTQCHSLTHLISLHSRWPRVSGNSRAPTIAAAILQDNDKLVQNVSAGAACDSQNQDNAINWPWAVWPAVSAASPGTGKRTRGDVSGKPAASRLPSDSTANILLHLVTFHNILIEIPSAPLCSRTLSQLSMGVTPGLPLSPFSSLALAMPGTPGNPWEQPSPVQVPWRKTRVKFTSTTKTKNINGT